MLDDLAPPFVLHFGQSLTGSSHRDLSNPFAFFFAHGIKWKQVTPYQVSLNRSSIARSLHIAKKESVQHILSELVELVVVLRRDGLYTIFVPSGIIDPSTRSP